MNIIKSFFGGLPSELFRREYQEDAVSAVDSSYDFAGEVTQEQELPNNRREIVLDNAIKIHVPTVKFAQNQQNTLFHHAFGHGILSAISAIGSAGLVYKGCTRDPNRDGGSDNYNNSLYALAFAAGIAAIRSFYLANKARSESSKWDDPVPGLQKVRKLAGDFQNNGFWYAHHHGLKGRIVSDLEMQHLFFREVSYLREQHEHAWNFPTQRSSVLLYNHRNPLRKHIVRSTFPGETVYDPKNKFYYWNVSDLQQKVFPIAVEIQQRIAVAHQAYEDAEQMSERERVTKKRAVDTTFNAISSVKNELKHMTDKQNKHTLKEKLIPIEQERDEKIRELKEKHEQLGTRGRKEDLDKKIAQVHQRFEQHPEVRKIRNEMDSEKSKTDAISAISDIGLGWANTFTSMANEADASKIIETSRQIRDRKIHKEYQSTEKFWNIFDELKRHEA